MPSSTASWLRRSAIASAARVSKRDLYAEFVGKREMLAACVQARSLALQAPLGLGEPASRAELADILIRYGTGLRLGVAAPEVIAAYRLVIQEAPHHPEAALTLHEEGRMASFNAVVALLRAGQAAGLLPPGPTAITRL